MGVRNNLREIEEAHSLSVERVYKHEKNQKYKDYLFIGCS